MVSSLGTKEMVVQCLELGALTFLQKPYSQEEFLKSMRLALAEAAP